MEFIFILITLLMLILMAGSVVGLIFPSIFKNKKTGEIPKRTRLFIYQTAGWIVCFIIIGFFAPTKEKPQEEIATHNSTSQQQTTAITAESSVPIVEQNLEQPTEPKEPLNLGITPEEYAIQFNLRMKKLKQPSRINPVVENGAVNNTFNTSVNDHSSIVGSVDKSTGKIKSIMIFAGGDGTDMSGLKIMTTFIAGISSLFPARDFKKINSEILSLIREGFDSEKKESEKILDGIKINFTKNDMTGIIIIAEPVSIEIE